LRPSLGGLCDRRFAEDIGKQLTDSTVDGGTHLRFLRSNDMQYDQILSRLAVGMALGAIVAWPAGVLAQAPGSDPASPATALAASENHADTQQAMLQPSRIVPRDSEQEMIAEGQKLFNGTCSHCHGPDAVQSVRRLDLRQLRHRYGETTETVFDDTVNKGRPAKGMPSWNQVFTEDKFRKLYAYLSTIQTP
jgi:mono/diheme cytochrome c family protein